MELQGATGFHPWQCCLCRKAQKTPWMTPAMCSPEAMPSCKSLNRSSLMLSLQDRQECPGLAGTTSSRSHLGVQSLQSPFGWGLTACACWLPREP